MSRNPARRSWLGPGLRQAALVVAMAVAMLLATAVLGARFLGSGPFDTALTLPWWVMAIAFAATEAFVVHRQVQREAQTVSVSEFPLVLGLFFASPLQLLVGRLIGSLVIFLVHRRSSALKVTWNLALFSLQTVLSVVLFRVLTEGQGPSSPLAWLGAYAGAIAANWAGHVAIVLVIAIYEGGLRLRPLLTGMLTEEPAAPVVITLGLLAAISLSAAPHSAWLLLVAGGGLLLGYRAYAALADRNLDLERLYRFTQAVTSSPEVDEILRNVLTEARELLHSERAEIAFVASERGDVAHVRLGAGGRLSRSTSVAGSEDQWLLSQVVTEASPVLIGRTTRDPEHRRWLGTQAAREAVAVPLSGAAGILGVLVVTDRLGEVRTYDEDDVLLLETVANHASVALQNGELVGKLRHDAMHDALTGLPNRAALRNQLSAALDTAADGLSRGTAVLILDLDAFRDINDTLGHEHGDLLLTEVAERLRTAVGAAGLVARLGGDEFAVLVHGADEEYAVRIGERMLRALEQPVVLGGLEVEVGASLGVALGPLHATDPAGLLKRADIAMSEAKGSTGGIRVYEPTLDADNPRRLMLVSELRTALNHGLLQVHVQPQARLDTGRVVSVEALARWNHPTLGTVGPDEFIPIAERSGLVGLLTSHVLDRSLAAVAAWRRQGHDLSIAVNLSTRSLHDADLVAEVSTLLRKHDVPAGRLTLEVTESSVMADPARAIALLHQLRELGVRLSVDDFGTGYSSLSYLKRLPVQEVKIDRSFVTGLREHGSEDVAIVRAIVDLGRHLGLEVVAEGVEDQETWDLLASMGCDLVQGWHLGKAMPVHGLVPWLAIPSPRAGGGLTAGVRTAPRLLPVRA
jgi:diguanylate cyclase (GGDEF)-like protein